MIHPWHDLPVGKDAPRKILALVEIPSGSQNKYELDKSTGLYKLDRVLHSAVHYPGDYGFIPRTLAEDGDPCDVLVLIREPTFTGCQIDARPIGILRMLDRGDPDDKILAVPAEDPFQSESMELDDMPTHTLREIAHFFEIYKDLEGKRMQILGWEDRRVAQAEIMRSAERYESTRSERFDATRLVAQPV